MCLVCSAWSGGPLCPACRRDLRAAPPRRVGSPHRAGLLISAPYRHEGPARALVHGLKYRGTVAAARVLAPAMAGRLPAGTAALVPVPRARLRSWRHGIDPAAELARQIARLTRLPVVAALRPALWWRAHAGGSRDDRSGPGGPRFTLRAPVVGGVLVDDVLTTGSTLLAAVDAVGPVLGAVTATAAVYS